jgi:iron(III) transport system substrate-binding protein
MRLTRFILALLAVAMTSLAALNTPVSAQTKKIVNVYSSRHYGALEAMFVKFTEETGIEVRVSQGSAQSILERLTAEGKNTPADLFFTIDAGGLSLAATQNLLQPIESKTLQELVPADLRSPDNKWFAVGQRFRTIVYNPAMVKPEELSTYEDLADPKWKGRLCLRPGTHIYTVTLIASLIGKHGEEKALEIVKGWVANKPQLIDSDTRILETLAAGGCDVAITNHYYLAQKLTADPKFPIKAFWANQADRGVHRNISGMGVTAAAVNKDNAIALIEWMVKADKGQSSTDKFGLPGGYFEYPIQAKATRPDVLKGFGEFKIDPLPLSEYGALQKKAIELMAKAGY